jgi:hypothetical protein
MDAPLRLDTTFSRRLSPLTRFAFLGGAVLLIPLLHPVADALQLGVGVKLFAAFSIWSSLRTYMSATARGRGEVSVDADGVHLGDALVPHAAIQGGYFTPATGKQASCVKLIGRGGVELGRIDVDGEAQADLLLDALRLGPAQRAARFSVLAPLAPATSFFVVAAFALTAGLFALAMRLDSGWPFALSLLPAALALAVLFMRCDVDVGADGLLLRHRLGSRFVPWAEVVSVRPYARGVAVNLKRGTIELPLSARAEVQEGPQEETRAALVDRASAALAAYRRDDEVAVAARVARGGRSKEAWFRRLFERKGDYRAAPLLTDQLWRIVESPAAVPTARAGAAAILAQSAGDVDRARLRIAADACAAPELRVVLDKAAEGATDEELREALAAIEDEVATRSKRSA